jgi:glycosyltransferase involved in cell wall biosynthesis
VGKKRSTGNGLPPSNPRALLVATTAPDGTTRTQTGSTNWTLRLCKTLHCQHDITLVSPPPFVDPWLLDSGIPLFPHELGSSGWRLLRLFNNLSSGIYPSIWTLYSPRTSSFLKSLPKGEFDVCWLLDDYAGIYLKDIPCHLPAIFVRHYLFSMQEDFLGGSATFSGFLRSIYHKRTALAFDRWTTRRASIVTSGTIESSDFLRNQHPGNRIEYLPTKPSSIPVSTDSCNLSVPSGPGGRLIALYLADMSFVRNGDGARWFLQEVLPLIPTEVREQYHFRFVGRKPEPLLDTGCLPPGSSVEFTGFVEDLKATLHSAQAAFIPIFGGNGIRLKTLSMLGSGLPTVSTKDALEGLDLVDGRHVLVANSPETFAKSFDRLLSVGTRLDLHRNALAYMGMFMDEEEDAGHLLGLSKEAMGEV